MANINYTHELEKAYKDLRQYTILSDSKRIALSYSKDGGPCSMVTLDIPDCFREWNKLQWSYDLARKVIFYYLLCAGIVFFRDDCYYHLGTLNKELAQRYGWNLTSPYLATDGKLPFFDLYSGLSLNDMHRLSSPFTNGIPIEWDIEVFFEYSI